MNQHPTKKNFNILFTCIGRRVSLLRLFRCACLELGLSSNFIGTDITDLSPALQLCDQKLKVSRVDDPEYLIQLLEIIEKYKIKLLVPTVDLDLKILAKNKRTINDLGCTVLISDPEVIDICQDKRATFNFLKNHKFGTPEAWTMEDNYLNERKFKFPVFLKPWDGHASKGTVKVNDMEELTFYSRRIHKCLVQEFITGREYTCDAYLDDHNFPHCVVPRKRIEIRNGEVSKGKVVKNVPIINEVNRLMKLLKAGPGVITTQLILTPDNEIKIIEINPRLGGGVPLAIKAGANFPRWIIEDLLFPHIKKNPHRYNYQDGLIMLRYDDEIWMDT